MNSCQLILQEAPHAPLYACYQPCSKRKVKVGRPGKYGPEDPDTGAQYKALGEERQGGVFASRDYDCSAFYPPTTFLSGRGERGSEMLPFEKLEAMKKVFWDTSSGWVLLPWGHDRQGQLEWQPAIMYYAHMKPEWYNMKEKLERCFPGADIFVSPKVGWKSARVFFECPVFEGGTFSYQKKLTLTT